MVTAVLAGTIASSLRTADAFWFPRGARVKDGRLLDIREFGAVAGASHPAVAVANAAAVTAALGNLTAGDTLLVPEGEFFAVGGIRGANLSDVTLQFNGSLHALPDFDHWPFRPSKDGGKYDDFVRLNNVTHVTVRGAPTGRIDGDGKK